MKKIIAISLVLIGLSHTAFSQENTVPRARFNANNSVTDIRLDAGAYFGTGIGRSLEGAPLVSFTYQHFFFGRLAYRAGLQYAHEAAGYGFLAAAPVGIAFRPGTISMGQSLTRAAEMSVYDVVRDGYYGRTDRMGSDILANLLLALFRRTEYFITLSPGMFGGDFLDSSEYLPGNRFSLTADAGFVLCIPIWRIGINITPSYHYSITKNVFYNDRPVRSFFSITGGLSYLF